MNSTIIIEKTGIDGSMKGKFVKTPAASIDIFAELGIERMA